MTSDFTRSAPWGFDKSSVDTDTPGHCYTPQLLNTRGILAALMVLVLSALLLCGDGQPWEGGGVNATSRCASWASWFRIKQVSVIVQRLSPDVNTSL